jgi:hypothetical protein
MHLNGRANDPFRNLILGSSAFSCGIGTMRRTSMREKNPKENDYEDGCFSILTHDQDQIRSAVRIRPR